MLVSSSITMKNSGTRGKIPEFSRKQGSVSAGPLPGSRVTGACVSGTAVITGGSVTPGVFVASGASVGRTAGVSGAAVGVDSGAGVPAGVSVASGVSVPSGGFVAGFSGVACGSSGTAKANDKMERIRYE